MNFICSLETSRAKRFRDYGGRAFSDLQIGKLRFGEPGHAGRHRRRRRGSPRGPAEVIHQHVVIFGATGGIEDNALEDFDQAEDLDFQSGLFADFAPQRLFETFAGFHRAAGQRPVVFQWLAAAFDQKNPVAVEDQRADAEDWQRADTGG